VRVSVCFVVPTTRDGQDRRGRALRSLLAQADPDWCAVVIGAGFAPDLPLETRFFSVRGATGSTNMEVVNDALNHVYLARHTGDLECEWLVLLNDCHTVSEQFVTRTKAETRGTADVIIFRSQGARGLVLPNPQYPALVPDNIGCGIVLRRAFAEDAGLRFEDVGDPIAYALTETEKYGARVLLHPSISFFDRDHRPSA
jgi:hypothetical protein